MIKAISNFENVNFYIFEPQAHFSSERAPVQKSLTFVQTLIIKVFSTYLHFADTYEMTFVEAHWLVRHEHIDASIVSIEKALGSWCGKPEWSARKKKLFPPRMLALALARLRSTGMTADPVFPPAAAPAEAKGAAVPATAAPWR